MPIDPIKLPEVTTKIVFVVIASPDYKSDDEIVAAAKEMNKWSVAEVTYCGV